MKKINVAIIGASGYTASELIRICYRHPNINIKYLVGNSKAGKNISEIYSHLKNYRLPKIISVPEINFSEIKYVFSCLPHGQTAKIIKTIPKKIRIIDLSSDYRINKDSIYEEYYKRKNPYSGIKLNKAYGLTEINRENIAKADLVACPGCYSTAVILALKPIIKIINKKKIIIDAKTGISGAGRKLSESNLFSEIY
jgi:N-acetyl-gamma-glutamyl-phosphate reductase